MTKVVGLTRNAQSTANAGQATTAPGTIPLTELGHRQALRLAETINKSPNLITTSPLERAITTAIPIAKRYPDVPFDIWPVEEFTYLIPSRLVGTTQAARRPMVDAYWNAGDQAAIDGPGADSFIQLLKRAKAMLGQLATFETNTVLVFSHGQFIRAVAWSIRHGQGAGTPENMRLFRQLDSRDPLPNCAGYYLELRDGRWEVAHQVVRDGEVKFIDEFCTDHRMAPIPPGVMTRERREILNGIRSARDDFTE